MNFRLLWKLKLIYSEKATKFCKISTTDLSYVVPVKSKVEILQNFMVFSEYMNFIWKIWNHTSFFSCFYQKANSKITVPPLLPDMTYRVNNHSAAKTELLKYRIRIFYKMALLKNVWRLDINPERLRSVAISNAMDYGRMMSRLGLAKKGLSIWKVLWLKK